MEPWYGTLVLSAFSTRKLAVILFFVSQSYFAKHSNCFRIGIEKVAADIQWIPTWKTDLEKPCLLMFLYFDHKILFNRQEEDVGHGGMVLKWFKSYLLDQFQFVLVKHDCSTCKRVSRGVPQGSVLWPNLWLTIFCCLKEASLGSIIWTFTVMQMILNCIFPCNQMRLIKLPYWMHASQMWRLA